MTLEVLGIIVASAKIKYLCTMICGKTLHKFDMLYAEGLSSTSENLKSNILGLGTYFFPVNALSKQNNAIWRGV